MIYSKVLTNSTVVCHYYFFICIMLLKSRGGGGGVCRRKVTPNLPPTCPLHAPYVPPTCPLRAPYVPHTCPGRLRFIPGPSLSAPILAPCQTAKTAKSTSVNTIDRCTVGNLLHAVYGHSIVTHCCQSVPYCGFIVSRNKYFFIKGR